LPKLKVIFNRSRRPLIGSLILLAIGLVLLIVVLPSFVQSLRAFLRMEPVDQAWPPDMQEQFRQFNRETAEAFYLWTAALAVTIAILLAGVRKYLEVRARREARERDRR
jgi:ABC-type Fe3+ transport system permease subunit